MKIEWDTDEWMSCKKCGLKLGCKLHTANLKCPFAVINTMSALQQEQKKEAEE